MNTFDEEIGTLEVWFWYSYWRFDLRHTPRETTAPNPHSEQLLNSGSVNKMEVSKSNWVESQLSYSYKFTPYTFYKV